MVVRKSTILEPPPVAEPESPADTLFSAPASPEPPENPEEEEAQDSAPKED